jgi:hypothetical protein
VTQARRRLENNAPARGQKPIGEVGFESVCDVKKVFIEAADGKRHRALDGEIAANEPSDPLAAHGGKAEAPGLLD